MPEAAAPIEEVAGIDPAALPEALLRRDQPCVLRGLTAHWPSSRAGAASASEAIAYLQRFASAAPAMVTLAPPECGGRIFYRDDMLGLGFRHERASLAALLDRLQRPGDGTTLYMGSVAVDACLPGFRADNDLGFGELQPLASAWVGNRTRIPTHQDLPDNIACVVAGHRRVTLFPPQQLPNLYVGPLELTPAGQPVSLVDPAAPDLARFPRYAEAMRHARVAELAPGDAVLIPSMWWHHMEALDDFNVLVNYWWRQSPSWMDTPMNALMAAILSVRDLPPAQREIWRGVFDHYVFDAGADTAAHIPEAARGMLGDIDQRLARELRARLLQRLNR